MTTITGYNGRRLTYHPPVSAEHAHRVDLTMDYGERDRLSSPIFGNFNRAELLEALGAVSKNDLAYVEGERDAEEDATKRWKDRAEAAEAKLQKVAELAESWRYKGEFGWGPWQAGEGPDPEGFFLDQAAKEVNAILNPPAPNDEQLDSEAAAIRLAVHPEKRLLWEDLDEREREPWRAAARTARELNRAES